MNTRNTLSALADLLLIPLVIIGLVLLYCMTWVFGGREWREFLSGRDLEHD